MSRPIAPSSPAEEAHDAHAAREHQYDENGVDLTLVRYTLSLTPRQRLKAVENYMRAIASVKPVPEPRRSR